MLYRDSGVDIGRGDSLVEFIKKIVTLKRENIGPFSAAIEIGFVKKYRAPVLVTSTDGIGTKIDLALQWDFLDGLGYDLFGMCVNDLATYGAKPLFFLDYYAASRLDLDVAKRVIASLVKACEEYNCPLVGGETAELPGLLTEGKFDIAGFVVGIQEKSRIPAPSKVKAGDILVGLPSSGIHSNGYSLVRAIVKKSGITEDTPIGCESARNALLKPTRIYSKIAEETFKKFHIRGAAHITGGGIPGNLVRCLPDDVDAVIDRKSWEVPEVFKFLQKAGDVPEDEMWKVFNMGIGFIFIVAKEDLANFERYLKDTGEFYLLLGQIVQGQKQVKLI